MCKLNYFASLVVYCFCFSRCSDLSVLVESFYSELCGFVRRASRPDAIECSCFADEGNYIFFTCSIFGRGSDVSKEDGKLGCGKGRIKISRINPVSDVYLKGVFVWYVRVGRTALRACWTTSWGSVGVSGCIKRAV